MCPKLVNLLRIDTEGLITENILRAMSMHKRIDFAVKCISMAEVAFDSTLAIAWMCKAVVPVVGQSQESIQALFDRIIRYQGIPVRSMVAFTSLLLWTQDGISLNGLFIRLFGGKTAPSTLLVHLTLVLLSFASGHEMSSSVDLLHVITTALSSWLYHAEPKVRMEAMILAEAFARISGTTKALYFELDEESEGVLAYRQTEIMVRLVDRIVNGQQEFVPYKFHNPNVEAERPPVQDYQQVLLERSERAVATLDDLALKAKLPFPSSMEPRNSKIRAPRFLRDCLDYLRSEDPDKWDLTLHHLPTILASSFHLEIRELGPQLFKTLLFLSDQYKLEGFEGKRMALLAGIVQHMPENALRMVKSEFVGRSLNLGQKSDILTLVMSKLKELISGQQQSQSIIVQPGIDGLLASVKLHDDFDSPIQSSPLTIQTLIRHFYLPLLTSLHHTRSTTFLTAHDFLLEKTILCCSMFFYLAGNTMEYVEMIRPLLRFLEPITSGGKGVTEGEVEVADEGLDG